MIPRTAAVLIFFLVIGCLESSSQSKSKNKTPLPSEILFFASNVKASLKPQAQPVIGTGRLDYELATTRLNEGRRIVEDALLAGDQMTESQAADFHRRMEMVSTDLVGLTAKDKKNRCAQTCYKNHAKGGPSRYWNMFSCLAICLGQ